MTLLHDTITIRQKFSVPPSRVFDAWRDTRQLAQWSTPGDGTWTCRVDMHEFAVGGGKRIAFGPKGQPPYVEDAHYLDIVEGRHIINSERILAGDGKLISTSLITLEFLAAGAGCELVVSDQITLLDASDTPDNRRRGWGEVMSGLSGFLGRAG